MNGIPAGVAGFSDVDDADDVAKPRSTDVFTGDVGGGVWSEGAGRGGAKSPAKVGEHEQFELLSPASSTIPPEVYTWPLDVQRNGTDPALQMVSTITLLGREELLRDFFDDEYEEARKSFVKTDVDSVRSLVAGYNRAIRAFWKSREEAGPDTGPMWGKMSTELLQHIMATVYSRSVTDPTKLNRYKGWSEEVYGEFSSSMVSELVEKVPIRPGDRFIDLGSGVGQVVLQVAAEAMCVDSFGVEKQDNPAEYATVMEEKFKSMMAWFGKMYGKHEILHGDFLEDKFRSRILDANLIFVNNFAFGTAVNQKLKEIFQYCHEGCRIVSSLNFAPMGFTITERTMGDIGCILSVRRATCTGEGVSWTARPFDYYVHTIDHTMMHEFFSNPDRRPVRCSAPEPEPIPPSPSPPPVNVLKVRAKLKAAEVVKRRALAVAAEKAKAKAARAAAAAKRASSGGDADAKRKPQGGPLTRTSDERRTALVALDKKLKPDMGAMISELELKASFAEAEVVETRKFSDKVAADTAELEDLVAKGVAKQMEAVRARLPGRAQLKGSTAAKQVQLAVDTVVQNQMWLRAHSKVEQEVQVLRETAEHLTALSTELAPEARCLACVTKALNIADEWDWNGTLAPTADSLAHAKGILRKRVPPTVRGLPGGCASAAVESAPLPADPLSRWAQVYFPETGREAGAASFESVRAMHKNLPPRRKSDAPPTRDHPHQAVPSNPRPHRGVNGSAGGHRVPPPPPPSAPSRHGGFPENGHSRGHPIARGGPPGPSGNGRPGGPHAVLPRGGDERNGFHRGGWDSKSRPLDSPSNGRGHKRQMTGVGNYNDRYVPPPPP